MLRINKKRCLKYTVKLKGNQGREPKIGVIYLFFFFSLVAGAMVIIGLKLFLRPHSGGGVKMKPPPACPFPISHQLLEDLCQVPINAGEEERGSTHRSK